MPNAVIQFQLPFGLQHVSLLVGLIVALSIALGFVVAKVAPEISNWLDKPGRDIDVDLKVLHLTVRSRKSEKVKDNTQGDGA